MIELAEKRGPSIISARCSTIMKKNIACSKGLVVKKALSDGALIVTKMDGEVFPQPINSDVVKKYYA